MPKIAYVEKKFNASSLLIIQRTNEIITDYNAQGFDLTLRQVYYQHVSRGWIANKDTEYKRLGSVINDARLAGLIDWNAITDRTRNLRGNTRWSSPADIIRSAAYGYHIDRWKGQPKRVEVWIEKDALVGVIAGVCSELDVPYFSCRGYTSQSEMWSAARRLRDYAFLGQSPTILHLGDHDPSGKDMTRDITERMELFMGGVPVERLALNYDQIEQYSPPPNPTKLTDSRATGYMKEFGDESWELDALEPGVIVSLVREAIEGVLDKEAWEDREAQESDEKGTLELVSSRWNEIVAGLTDE